MITFATEKFEAVERDGKEIFPLHWQELALDKDAIPLDMDFALYHQIEDHGKLHVVTVRCNGQLVGYYIATILPHLHYKSAGIMAMTDIYYLLPEFRQGGCGARMLMYVEASLRERGCKKIYLTHKVHFDHEEMFTLLGYKLTDKVYTKMLGAA